MTAESLRIHLEEDAFADPQSMGFARVPRSITSSREISRIAKIALDAILGFCWGDERICYPSLDELERASALPRRTLQRALEELVRLKRIHRERDPSRRLRVWVIRILFDPRNPQIAQSPIPEIPANDAPTRHQWRVHAPPVAPQRATGGASPSFKFEQSLLDFTKTKTGEESSSSLSSLQEPEGESNPLAPTPELVAELMSLPGATEQKIRVAVEEHGLEWVDRAAGITVKAPAEKRCWAYFLRILANFRGPEGPAPPRVRPKRHQPEIPRVKTIDEAPPVPYTAELLAEHVEAAKAPGWAGQLLRSELRRSIDAGLIPADLVGMVPRTWLCPEPETKKPAAGRVDKLPPQPVGDPSSTAPNSTGGINPRQNQARRSPDQRARKDSNLQPSDSKSAQLKSVSLDATAPTDVIPSDGPHPHPISDSKPAPETKHCGSTVRGAMRC